MEVQKPIKGNQNIKQQLIIILTFVLLFATYHAAEYMIVFKNNVVGFLLFQLLFFLLAFFLGNLYSQNGLTAWGLPFSKKSLRNFLIGIVIGIGVYATTYLLSHALGLEKIIKMPRLPELLKVALPFTFGVFFSSLSEDVLTRGLLFTHFRNRIKTGWLITFSATIYLLNHIYRLNDGPEALLYLFLLGVLFIIPVVNTKKLWLTAGMHWAGNSFFFITHSVIETETTGKGIPPNYLFSIVLAVFIPLCWILTRRISIKSLKEFYKNSYT